MRYLVLVLALASTFATANETQKLSKSGTNFAAGVSFGSLASRGVGYYGALDKAWAMGPLYIYSGIELSILPNSGPTSFLTGAHFGAQVYLMEKDIAPFVAFDFGPSLVRVGTGDVYAGLGLGATVGLGLFRSYDLHGRVGLRFASVIASAAPSVPINWAIFLGLGF